MLPLIGWHLLRESNSVVDDRRVFSVKFKVKFEHNV